MAGLKERIDSRIESLIGYRILNQVINRVGKIIV